MKRLVVLSCAVVFLVGAQSGSAAAPANDDFASASVIAAGGGNLSSSNVDATKQVGEPDHAGDAGGASIWFRWTPNFTGTAVVDTSGSDVDTLLDAYTGGSVSSLTRIAANDDFGGAAGASRICFDVTASSTYMIAVDGYAGDEGNVALAWGSKGADTTPCPKLPPTVAGTPKVGQVLTVDNGTWSGTTSTFARQWVRCAGGICQTITGATGTSYTLTPRDVGTDIRVDVTASDGTNTARSTSDPSPVVGMTASLGSNGRIFWATNRNSPAQYDIYAANSDGSASVPIRATADFETEPAPSPDGSKIAYTDLTGGGLTIASSDGGSVTPLNVSGWNPVWSPDGSRLAFVDYIGGSVYQGELHIANATTGSWIVVPVDGPVYDVDWSPDGTKLALSVEPPGEANYHIALLNADGSGGLKVLTSATTDDKDPSWSPDGSKIAFARSPVAGGITDGDIYAIDANGTNETLLYNGSTLNNNIAVSPDWSPDGTKIVFTTGVLHVMGSDGNNPTQITPGSDAAPKWSVAYTAPSGGGGGGGSGGGGGGGSNDLRISGSVTPDLAPVGGSHVWRLRVSNTGGGIAFGVVVDIQLSPNIAYGFSQVTRGSGCVNTGNRLHCNLDLLGPAGNDSSNGDIIIGTNVTAIGLATLTAVAAFNETDPTPANNTLALNTNIPAPPAPAPPPRTPSSQRGITKTGTQTADRLVGTAFADVLRGMGGNDTILGQGGNDILNGGTGLDVLKGGGGNDTIVGGLGADLIDGGPGSDHINSRDGQKDTIRCGTGQDTITADKKDNVSRDCETIKRL